MLQDYALRTCNTCNMFVSQLENILELEPNACLQGEKKKIEIVSGHTSTDKVCLSD